MTRRQRRRRCRICGGLYWPNAKTRTRQQVCSSPECQERRHREGDDAWHARHPDYDVARRLRTLKDRLLRSGDVAEVVRREEPPVCALPADEVKEQFGTDGLAILVILARLLRKGQPGRGHGQPIEIAEETGLGSVATAALQEAATVGNCGKNCQSGVCCGTDGQLDVGARKTRYGHISRKSLGNSASKIRDLARRDIELTRHNHLVIRQVKSGTSQDETAPGTLISRLSAAAHEGRTSGGYGLPQEG